MHFARKGMYVRIANAVVETDLLVGKDFNVAGLYEASFQTLGSNVG